MYIVLKMARGMYNALNRIALVLVFALIALFVRSPGMTAEGLGRPTRDDNGPSVRAPAQAPPLATARAPGASATVPPPKTPAAAIVQPRTLPVAPTTALNLSGTNAPPLSLRTDLPALALRDWPRPANDNGRCMHFLASGFYNQRVFKIQMPRLQALHVRWVLALYSDQYQLRVAAMQFKAAGIVPIWRRTMRPYQSYGGWATDVQVLKDIGLPPYFQIYNEPDISQEWDGQHPMDRNLWITNFVNEAQSLYNAGGYVGIQTLDEKWLAALLETIKARKGERLFGRMFFVPHPYGLNHPPSYVQDDAAILGYRTYVPVFQQEIGFVPPFIAGEAGWKYGENEDDRFPSIDDQLHAQYHVEMFNWFRLGKVSDGQPLPDYIFAMCPWLISSTTDTGAWYDSPAGNRNLTITQVERIPSFTRRFSWDEP